VAAGILVSAGFIERGHTRILLAFRRVKNRKISVEANNLFDYMSDKELGRESWRLPDKE
jgi:hypothetical protein